MSLFSLAHSKRLFVLMLPILITQLAQAGFGVVDSIMAGQVSAHDLAAISVGASMWLPMFLFMTGVIIATTPLIGELVGQKQTNKISYVIQQSLWMSLAIGIIGALLINILPFTFDSLGVPKTLQQDARHYIFAVSLGLPAIALYTSLRSYTESLNHPIPVAVISVIGLLLDIPLNYVFIYGKFGLPELGGVGCGYATALIFWFNVVTLALYLAWTKRFAAVRFYQQFSGPNRAYIQRILKLGLPIGIAIFFEASLFSLGALIISPLGDLTVAAHQVALSVTSQLFMLPLSVAMTLTILISQFYGEQDWQALKQMQMTGLILVTAIALVSMVITYVLRLPIATLFTDNTVVINQAVTLLLFAIAYQLFDGLQVATAGILRGLQDTTIPMWITFFGYWGVALPMGIYLTRYTQMGASGFWFALIVGLSIACVGLLLRLLMIEKRRFVS